MDYAYYGCCIAARNRRFWRGDYLWKILAVIEGGVCRMLPVLTGKLGGLFLHLSVSVVYR